MAGFDKWLIMEKLKRLGWTEAEPDDPERPYQMIPPASLFANRPKTFHVYEAEDLQNLLGEPVDDNDE